MHGAKTIKNIFAPYLKEASNSKNHQMSVFVSKTQQDIQTPGHYICSLRVLSLFQGYVYVTVARWFCKQERIWLLPSLPWSCQCKNCHLNTNQWLQLYKNLDTQKANSTGCKEWPGLVGLVGPANRRKSPAKPRGPAMCVSLVLQADCQLPLPANNLAYDLGCIVIFTFLHLNCRKKFL